jgi:predicted lipid-binding transport protein (Tim44 family)
MKNRFMNKLFVSLFAVIASVALIAGAPNAEAKRMGGGNSVGKSSQTATPGGSGSNASNASTAPAAAKTAAPATAPAAAPASNRSKWLGPLAGLAAGLGLAALASHLGFGEGFGNIMMILLLAMVAFAAFKFFMSRRAAGSGTSSSPSGLMPSYAAAGGSVGGSTNNTHYQAATPQSFQAAAPSSGYTGGIGAGIAPIGGAATLEPIAGFDEAAFVRQAKVYFVRLQAAYDAADQKDLREFTSPEMFGELMMEINERNGAANRTETVKLDAECLGHGASSDLQHVSVRFFGTVKEFEGAQTHAEPHDINETWNFAKPTNGAEGWTLVGIEQN